MQGLMGQMGAAPMPPMPEAPQGGMQGAGDMSGLLAMLMQLLGGGGDPAAQGGGDPMQAMMGGAQAPQGNPVPPGDPAAGFVEGAKLQTAQPPLDPAMIMQMLGMGGQGGQ